MTLISWLEGKKTYIVGILTLLVAVGGYYLHIETLAQMLQLISTALIGMGLRRGLTTTVMAVVSTIINAIISTPSVSTPTDSTPITAVTPASVPSTTQQ